MTPIRVLFLCTGNSARSIIAEALLKQMDDPNFEVYSAGVEPKGINPFARRVLEDDSVDCSWAESKPMSLFLDQRFDYVITLCDNAAEQCPVFPGDPERIHWSFSDPAAVQGSELTRLTAFQETLRGMKQRLSLFIPVARRTAAQV